MKADVCRALIAELRPTGDVLELACGTGAFTREIVRHAQTVTAVNASSRMLAINRTCVNDPTVRYVRGDVFPWIPDRTYDVVFFGFWLSHVPPSAVHDFWTLVRKCLASLGRVAFVDEDDRAAGHDDVYVISGIPVARRSLSNDRQFEIVKIVWRPDERENGLRSSAWDVQVRRVGRRSCMQLAVRVGQGSDSAMAPNDAARRQRHVNLAWT